MRHLAAILGLVLFSTACFAVDPKPAADPFESLPFRCIGPAAGGRVCRVSGVPGDPLIYYAATAGGGVWKSVDGGLSWKPIFDDQPISSIGSIAVAPSDPNVVYVGSGEANIRGNVAAGNGIYVSTDAGKSWNHVWKSVGQIGTMAVHPTNADIAFAAVLGSPFGPGSERGVFRTIDGGKNWKRVLFKDDDTGASDICFDPSNPRILFAGLWQARRKPWEMTSGGPGSGMYTSRDGGDTWTQLKPEENGLPKGPWGKIGVVVAPADSHRVFALIESDDGGLFRSNDGGEKWSRVSDSRLIRQRAFYYTNVIVDPVNADVVWCPQVGMLKSIDGGSNFASVSGIHHGDHHDVWIDPKNPKRIIAANDGGVDISTDGGKSWRAPPLPISQFYHITCDNSVPYRVMGNMQDLGTANGPSIGLVGGKIRLGDWFTNGGGETGTSVADPTDSNVIYSGEYGGILTRYDRRTGQAKNVSAFPFNPSGIAPADLKYRFQWTAPILISPHDSKTIYHGANVIFRTTDAGQTWTAISGDLSRNDKQKQQWSGGPITGDNTGVEIFGTVFVIAESKREKGLLWAGSDDGLVHVSKDAGTTWNNVTANIPELPEWATIVGIEPSPFDAGTAYVVAEAHRLNDFRPYLWKTTDYGKTWTSLTKRIPGEGYLHVVRCDPAKRGILFVGTERGVIASVDDGATWKALTKNLPTVAVHDLVVKGNDLVVGTMGRSIWILDDISPLREWSEAIKERPSHVFSPSATTRWRQASGFSHDSAGAGENPPAGVVVNYRLAKKPAKPLKFEVLDSQGKILFDAESADDKVKAKPDEDDEGPDEMELPDKPGMNRAVWDLRAKGAEFIPGAKVDAGNPATGILVPPGTYTIRMTVDGQTRAVKATVKPDPRVKINVAEQYELLVKVRDDVTKLAGTVQQLRGVRKQLESRNELLEGEAKWEALRKSSRELIEKLDILEQKLHNPKAKVTYDIFGAKGGAMLYSQLTFVYSNLLDADGPPTQGVREVYATQSARLSELLAEFQTLTSNDLAKLNTEAKKLDLPTTIVPSIKPTKTKKKSEPGS